MSTFPRSSPESTNLSEPALLRATPVPYGEFRDRGEIRTISVTLSRWTLSYFATALAALIAAEGLMVAGVGFPNAPLQSPATLVLVHVVALGWLSLSMCGMLYQFVPVLVTRPLFSDLLPLPTLGFLIAGICTLVVGFLDLAGRSRTDVQFLPVGAILLGCGFGLVVWNLGRTLWAAQPLPLPAHYIVVGLCSLTATIAFGIIFSVVLSGWTSRALLMEVARVGLSLHVVAGLLGWLTFTAMGVSYRLMATFMLAPEFNGGVTQAALYAGTAALAIAVEGGTVQLLVNGKVDTSLLLAGTIGLLAVSLYGIDIFHLYRTRKRRKVEISSRMAGLASLSLGGAVWLSTIFLALGELDRHIGAIVFLLAFGWLSGLSLSKIYKIVPFVTWLECYGPIFGKSPTPRVQDLVVETRAFKWFTIYFVAVWLGEVALLAGFVPGFRLCAGLMSLGTAGIIRQLVRARRLSDVSEESRLPTGARYPLLLLSFAPQL